MYAEHGSKLSAFDDGSGFPVVGDGPFILAGYTQGQSITLKANPAYWRGRPKFVDCWRGKLRGRRRLVSGFGGAPGGSGHRGAGAHAGRC